jgi:hypothetical protein
MGPHPHRVLTLMLRRGFSGRSSAWPQALCPYPTCPTCPTYPTPPNLLTLRQLNLRYRLSMDLVGAVSKPDRARVSPCMRQKYIV